VKHHATKYFWECHEALPAHIQRLANSQFVLLKNDPRHPSLHLKNVGRYWSVRVGSHYRALAVREDECMIWFWIGHHAEYDRLITGR